MTAWAVEIDEHQRVLIGHGMQAMDGAEATVFVRNEFSSAHVGLTLDQLVQVRDAMNEVIDEAKGQDMEPEVPEINPVVSGGGARVFVQDAPGEVRVDLAMPGSSGMVTWALAPNQALDLAVALIESARRTA